jgi:hypothetical protein
MSRIADQTDGAPAILFGAFDRHNFGDMLFAHVAAAMLAPRQPVFAGLAERDLTRFGGHRVRAIAGLAREWGDAPADLVHVGGEILGCDVWQAAVMLLRPEEVGTLRGLYEPDPPARLAWARGWLGVAGSVAYAVPKTLFRRPGRFAYNAVGGADLAYRESEFRDEALARLREADFVGVRDDATLAAVAGAGIAARLMPDPAVMVEELFRARIRQREQAGEPAAMSAAFPGGYVAVQFGAEFGDDATLASIAGQLDRLAREAGFGVVFFRAGAAPWHDDLAVFRRTGAAMHARWSVFEALDIWDICALIAGSRGFCGSSLHGRIVALAYGMPRLSLVQAGADESKLQAFVRTWDAAHPAGTAPPLRIAAALLPALHAGVDEGRHESIRLAKLYRERFGELRAALDGRRHST